MDILDLVSKIVWYIPSKKLRNYIRDLLILIIDNQNKILHNQNVILHNQSKFNYILYSIKNSKNFNINYLSSIKREIVEKKDNIKNNKCIYTCLTGDYDNLFIHTYIDNNWDYICFTDNEDFIKLGKYGNWLIKPLLFNELDNTRNARWHKTHPHIIISDYDYSIYLDSNIDIKTNYIFNRVIELLNNNISISIPNHFIRDCIYDEANEVIKNNIDDPIIVNSQINLYIKDNYPKHYGMTETLIVFRKHNDKEIIKLMEDWWYWIKNYSKRDQLSLHYVLFKNNYTFPFLTEHPVRLDSINFDFFKHKVGILSIDELIIKNHYL